VKKAFALLCLFALTVSGQAFPRLGEFASGMDASSKRFLVPAKVDGKPATLALDTGTEGLFLFKPAAERLGLKVSDIPSDLLRKNGKFPVLETDPHKLTLFDTHGYLQLAIVDFSVSMDVDGCVGWSFFKNTIFQIDVANRTVRSLPAVPLETRQWATLGVRRSSDVFCLELPDKTGVILIDTGNYGGVSLSPERWRAWTNVNPHLPKTLTTYYMGGSGVVVGEEAWAQRLSFGPMVLNNVPVRPASASDAAVGSARAPYQATLGLTALERLDFIVDGPARTVYMRPRTGPFQPYAYNRAGAVFSPRDPRKDKPTDFVAHVLENGPAYQAGIRDGDTVTKVNGQTPSNWKNSPTYLSSSLPAGTKLNLTLKRGDTTFDTVLVLEDLFPATASGPNKPAN
jgi:hypothetical protein